MNEVWRVLYIVGIWNIVLVILGLVSWRSQESKAEWWSGWDRVLAIVPAHDEEVVVGSTVDCLMACGCTVVVVADGCSDGTVEIARAHGAAVYEVQERNKGAAINAYLEGSDLSEGFVGVTVVDCGTVVGLHYADRVVEALKGAEYVQGWLHSVGKLSWVGAWVSWQYGMMHLMALGRQLLGLPGWIGGTGFAWRSSEKVRFDRRFLTEDLELSLRVHGKGARVAYCDLGVLDEKPSTLRGLLGQHMRWARGHWVLLFHGRFLTWRIDDGFVVLSILCQLMAGFVMLYGWFVSPLFVLLTLSLYGIMGLAGMVKLGDGSRVRVSLLVGIPVLSVWSGFIALCALFTCRKRQWVRTAHNEIGVPDRLLDREGKMGEKGT
jgi:cellulose synthase/poly-beta-1,6-N-acetylglucosamine synthase-like glycosyltransferase